MTDFRQAKTGRHRPPRQQSSKWKYPKLRITQITQDAIARLPVVDWSTQVRSPFQRHHAFFPNVSRFCLSWICDCLLVSAQAFYRSSSPRSARCRSMASGGGTLVGLLLSTRTVSELGRLFAFQSKTKVHCTFCSLDFTMRNYFKRRLFAVIRSKCCTVASHFSLNQCTAGVRVGSLLQTKKRLATTSLGQAFGPCLFSVRFCPPFSRSLFRWCLPSPAFVRILSGLVALSACTSKKHLRPAVAIPQCF